MGRAFAGALRRGGSHPLAHLAVLGLLVRLALAPFTSWTGDQAFFYWASLDMIAGRNAYASMLYSYPPGWAYTIALPVLFLSGLVPSGELAVFVPAMVPVASVYGMVVPTVTSPAFNLVTKTPLILADLGVGVLLYAMVREVTGERKAKGAFAFWFLNPLVILVGSVSGQFDVLPAFFLLASAFFLLRRQPFYAGLALFLSASFKVFAIFFVPAYLVLLMRDTVPGPNGSGIRAPLHRFAAGFAAALVPMAIVFPWADGTNAILRRASVPIYGGFTPFTLLSFGTLYGIGPTLTVVSIAGPMILLAAVAWFFLPQRSSGDSRPLVLRLAAFNTLAIVVIFAFSPIANPQYLLWILPNMILLQSLARSSRRFVIASSGIALAYLLALAGPLAFLYPAAVWYGLPSTASINGSILGYWQIAGIAPYPIWFEIVVALSLIGFAVLVLQAMTAFRFLRGDEDE